MAKPRHDTLYLILAVLLGLLVRLDFLNAGGWIIDSDEGIVGLMAKHIAEGRGIPIFYYGQPYMGSFEALLAAILFKIAGVSSVSLKLVPLTFSLMLIPLMYALGDLLGGRAAGRTAALLWALPPSPLVVWSAMARGGFIEIVWLTAVAMYLTVLWLREDKPKEFSIFIIALVLGFGWWVNNQIVFIGFPIAFFIFCRLISERRGKLERLISNGAVGLGGFLLGSLPFWIYNLQNSFKSFGILGSARGGDIGPHLVGLFSTALPMLLGAKRFWHEEDIFPGATICVLLLYLLLTGGILALRAPKVADLLRFKIDRRMPIELPLLFIVTALCAFAFSSYGHLFTAPRYLLPIYVGVFLLVGHLVGALTKLNPVLSRSVVFLLLAIGFCSCYLGGRALPGQPFVAFGQRATQDHAELYRWLADRNVHMVRTNYWIGYRLAFETEEQVRFKIFQEPSQVRLPEYEAEAAVTPESDMPYVLVPAQSAIVKTALDALGYGYQEDSASGYVILSGVRKRFPPLQPVDRSLLKVESSVHSADIQLALDGDAATRWGSGEPQKPGMTVSLLPLSPVEIRGISYDIDRWLTDYPRGLTISITDSAGEGKVVLTDAQYKAIRYMELPEWVVVFDPIQAVRIDLTQTGSDPFFDWSLGELELWQ